MNAWGSPESVVVRARERGQGFCFVDGAGSCAGLAATTTAMHSERGFFVRKGRAAMASQRVSGSLHPIEPRTLAGDPAFDCGAHDEAVIAFAQEDKFVFCHCAPP